jgi:ABC-type polysaccharide/polyol phosphate transport system ATPase subunit
VAVIEVDAVSKTFWIPAVRRDTVRERVLGVLDPQRFRRLQVLDRVGLTVEHGEAVGVMGRNGCGKSTLLKIITGVYPPDDGVVRTKAAITPVLELGVGWSPDLDAIDNVFLIGSVMGLTLAEIRGRMERILAFAELERFANLKLRYYSSGMAARLGYAVAFEAVRGVLVLDEIFAVGDAGFKARCVERFRELRGRGHAVLLVSHDPNVVRTFCDRAVLLESGQVAIDGAPREVADRYVSMVTGMPGVGPGGPAWSAGPTTAVPSDTGTPAAAAP